METSEDSVELHKELLVEHHGLSVYVVDGSKIRKDVSINFVVGGHDLRYTFIPNGEIWLDDEQGNEEMLFTLLHEATERGLMETGMGYEDAHAKANDVEQAAHKNPDILEEELVMALETNSGVERISKVVRAFSKPLSEQESVAYCADCIHLRSDKQPDGDKLGSLHCAIYESLWGQSSDDYDQAGNITDCPEFKLALSREDLAHTSDD